MKLFLSVIFALFVNVCAGAQGVRHLKKGATGKKGKKGKKGSKPLIANLGNPSGAGRVTLRFNPDDSMLIHINAVNVNAMCDTNDCLLRISEGTCDSIGEDFTAPGYEDAWSNGENYYTLDGNGISRNAFVTNNGYGYSENYGKAISLSDSTGAVWACSTLMSESTKPNTVSASIGLYPNYQGNLRPSGTVTVTFDYDNTFKFEYNIHGLENNCVGCGIHIHAGVSCETHEQVMGHGWNADFVRDLWKSQYGAVYNTDGNGSESSHFYLYNGWNVGINYGHAVVLHGQDGTRLACGILQ